MDNSQCTLMLAVAIAFPLVATAAQARPHQIHAPTARYGSVDKSERYPLGEREFYYQFAEGRGSLATTDEWGELAAMPIPATNAGTGQAWINNVALSDAGEAGISVSRVEAAQVAPAAPQPSSFALPIAALGLMLFVARRRISM